MITAHMQSEGGWRQSWQTDVWWMAEPRQRGLRGTQLRMFAQYPKLSKQLMTGLREYGTSRCYVRKVHKLIRLAIADDPSAPLIGNCWCRR